VASLSGRRVLVTGVSGFVGDHLSRALTRAGAQVWGSGFEPELIPRVGTDGTLRDYLPGIDLADAAAADRLLAWSRPDAIVHLAGQSSPARSFVEPLETFRANVLGTWHLLDAIRAHAPHARVIVVASGEVYGPQAAGERANEDSPFRPVSPYALSKATADALAEAYARSHGLDVIRVRAFGHTGPGQDTRFVVPSFAEQIAAIEAGRAEPVLKVGNLDVERDLSDVRDVAEAYVALLERGRAGAAYNVCRGEAVRLTDVVRSLAALARVEVRIEVDPARVRPADVPRLVGNPARMAADTGWKTTITLEQTLADVLNEWRERTRGPGTRS
jgi:GDP-4-dehydro-6-deoxy-D-mannose reductase